MILVDRIVEAIIAGLMALLVVLVFCAVVFRYGLGSPLTWSEELGRSFLVWVSFLGAYLAHRRSQHIAVTFIRERLSNLHQKWISTALAVLLLGFLSILCWYGTIYSLTFMSSTTPLLKIPVGLIYMAMPVSMLLLFVSILLSLVRSVAVRPTD